MRFSLYHLILFFVLFLGSGCAKLSYLLEQGQGQLAIDWKAKSNEQVLKDESVAQSDKKKILAIQKYKKFFYAYFGKKPTGIYSKTTILDRDAVSYLVVASPTHTIEAIEHDFPIMGKFPYLGFFSRQSANSFAQELKEKGMHTYMRPVYAYSTLNQWIFDDKILSSFFVYEEEELAELIFHELFHTIYFVKNETQLNENLAQYFARELVFEYFKYSEDEKKSYFERHKRNDELSKLIVRLAGQLQAQLDKHAQDNLVGRASVDDGPERSVSATANAGDLFLKDVFYPTVRKACAEIELDYCWPLSGEWNNARFAAFLTYESEQGQIREFVSQNNLSAKEFFQYLEQMQNRYIKGEFDVNKLASFTDILFQDKL